MSRLKFTKKAINDLSSIWYYTSETWSEKQANIYYQMLLDICNDISIKPDSGKIYPQVHPKILGIRIAKHIIFYRIINDSTVEITRILHERMDLKQHLSK